MTPHCLRTSPSRIQGMLRESTIHLFSAFPEPTEISTEKGHHTLLLLFSTEVWSVPSQYWCLDQKALLKQGHQTK
jgi:hypothetical protein